MRAHRHTIAQQRVRDLRLVANGDVVQQVAPCDVRPSPDAAVSPYH